MILWLCAEGRGAGTGAGHVERVHNFRGLIDTHVQPSNTSKIGLQAVFFGVDLLAISGDHVIHRFKCSFQRDRLILCPQRACSHDA